MSNFINDHTQINYNIYLFENLTYLKEKKRRNTCKQLKFNINLKEQVLSLIETQTLYIYIYIHSELILSFIMVDSFAGWSQLFVVNSAHFFYGRDFQGCLRVVTLFTHLLTCLYKYLQINFKLISFKLNYKENDYLL